MISLKDKILNESILGSTKSGKEGLRSRVEEWIDDNNLKDAFINPDCSVTIGGRRNVVKGNIPDFIILNSVQNLTITECTSLKNFPKTSAVLTITNSTFDNFTELDIDYCKSLRVFNCDFKSLKGIPKDCVAIYLGNNTHHFVKKDIKKLVNTKPQNIYTLGYYNNIYCQLLLGQNDVDYCNKEIEKLEKQYHKAIPELDHIVFSGNREDYSIIYIKLDFLPRSEHFNGISDNSIYLQFKYDIDDSTIEYLRDGHLDLTQKDKEGKYKYYALKGFTAPYYDAGGKKFRKTRIDNFDADSIFNKTIDWIKAVVDAALEDQGGVLKRK
jgi:hypothetical protein